MRCREAVSEIHSLAPGEVPSAGYRAHLSSCPACRAEAERLGDLQDRLGTAARAPVPEAEIDLARRRLLYASAASVPDHRARRPRGLAWRWAWSLGVLVGALVLGGASGLWVSGYLGRTPPRPSGTANHTPSLGLRLRRAPSPNGMTAVLELQLRARHLAEAEQSLRLLLGAGPTGWLRATDLAQSHLRSGEAEQAAWLLERLYARGQSSARSNVDGLWDQIAGSLGDAEMRLRHYDRAVEPLREALAVHPWDTGRRTQLYHALRGAGRAREADRVLWDGRDYYAAQKRPLPGPLKQP